MIDGWKGVETDRDEHFVYMFGRLAPGATMEQAAASLNPTYHAIINDVEAPRIKGMSARDRGTIPRPGHHAHRRTQRPELDYHDVTAAADAPLRRHGHRAAHRLRQHRQSAAGTRGEPHHGDGGAALARRHASAAHHAGPHRVGAARGARRDRECASSRTGRSRDHRALVERRCPRVRLSLEHAGLRVHGGRLAGDRSSSSGSHPRSRARGPTW